MAGNEVAFLGQIHHAVELHYGQKADYDVLHVQMTAQKFVRTIEGADGKIFHLPTATYYSFGEISSSEVRELAATAARITGKTFWILTVNYSDAAWYLNEDR